MDLPSTRELELETLLREKDGQLAEVTDEIVALRQYLSKQPGPSTTDAVTLPPALLSVLLPHINSAASSTATTSSTVTAALTQRARLLQEENDELYELLRSSETGKLKDEVRGLRRTVVKLQVALEESHLTIKSLSTELDKTRETLMSSSRQIGKTNKSKSHSHSPHDLYHTVPHSDTTGNGNTTLKPPPTGPRAHKRPRLSDAHASPPHRLPPSLPQKPQAHHHSSLPPRVDVRDQGRQPTDNRGKPDLAKMDVEGEGRAPSPANPNRNREREKTTRDRERGRERGVKEKEKERVRDAGKDRDRDANKPFNRRNGHMSGAPGRGGGGGSGAPSGRKGNDRNNNSHNNQVAEHASRTLQERLGL